MQSNRNSLWHECKDLSKISTAANVTLKLLLLLLLKKKQINQGTTCSLITASLQKKPKQKVKVHVNFCAYVFVTVLFTTAAFLTIFRNVPV